MNAEQIEEFLQGFRAKSSVKVRQSAEEIARMIELWTPYRPADLIWDEANERILLEHCLAWYHGYVDLSGLSKSADAHYGAQELRRHVAPQPAPVIAEPPAPQPKLEGRDSLGDGATSVEKPISSVVSPATESTALQDGVDYAWNRSNYNNQLAALKLQAWRETPLDAHGQINHAARQRRYNELRREFDKSIEPKRNDSLQKITDGAFAEARRAGVTTYNEMMKRIDAAVEAATKE